MSFQGTSIRRSTYGMACKWLDYADYTLTQHRFRPSSETRRALFFLFVFNSYLCVQETPDNETLHHLLCTIQRRSGCFMFTLERDRIRCHDISAFSLSRPEMTWIRSGSEHLDVRCSHAGFCISVLKCACSSRRRCLLAAQLQFCSTMLPEIQTVRTEMAPLSFNAAEMASWPVQERRGKSRILYKKKQASVVFFRGMQKRIAAKFQFCVYM